MVVKGLLESYKPFVMHITQTNDVVTFVEFKAKLQSYERKNTENMGKIQEKYGRGDVNVQDNVMKTTGARRASGRGCGKKTDLADVECYTCGKKGHMSRACPDEIQQRREDRKWDTPQRGKGRGRG